MTPKAASFTQTASPADDYVKVVHRAVLGELALLQIELDSRMRLTYTSGALVRTGDRFYC